MLHEKLCFCQKKRKFKEFSSLYWLFILTVFLFHCSLFGSSWLIPNVSFYLFHLLSTMGSLSKMCLQTLSLLIGLGLNIFCKWNFHHRLLAYNCSKEFWDLFLRSFWLFMMVCDVGFGERLLIEKRTLFFLYFLRRV